ncbi:MAG: hypothetical protein IPM06_16740 [Rhizobiales bacterium]|nr:hypothetical protein [Hyphomicrobiales bacterium]
MLLASSRLRRKTSSLMRRNSVISLTSTMLMMAERCVPPIHNHPELMTITLRRGTPSAEISISNLQEAPGNSGCSALMRSISSDFDSAAPSPPQ